MDPVPRIPFDAGLPVPAPGRRHVREREELFSMWTSARAEANAAYDAWRLEGGRDRFCSYRAAEERADAAQDALAEACARYPRAGGFHVAA